MGKILSRIKQIAENENITIGALERKIGASKGVLSRAITNDTDIQAKWLERIVENFPCYSPSWLLNGVGEMIISNDVFTPNTPTTSAKPFYGNLPVSAGVVMQYPNILSQQATGLIDLPQTHGAEFFFPVIGMSMKPTIEEGEIIGVAHIDRLETTNADRIYMLITRDGERMIKRILQYNKERGTITLGSDNPNYPNNELDVNMLLDVYKVMFHMRIETL